MTVIGVINGLLEKRLAYSLDYASLDLSFHEHRFEEVPAVVDCRVSNNLDDASFRIDLHFGNVTTVWEGLRGSVVTTVSSVSAEPLSAAEVAVCSATTNRETLRSVPSIKKLPSAYSTSLYEASSRSAAMVGTTMVWVPA